MCFSPQRRAIFRHRNFKKCSETDVFCTLSLQNVLFATAAYNFSTSELPIVLRNWRVLYTFAAKCAFRHSGVQFQKVLRNWRVLYTFASKCAFCHSGVQFFDIWTSKSAPRPSVFKHFHFKMCFSPQRRAIFDVSSQHYLRTRRFNRLTFRLTRHTNHWKNTAFRDFSNIWRGCIFFLLTFALLHLLSADLTTLLCFSTVHIVGSFYLNFLRT